MTRVLILVQRPYHLSTEEAESWLRRQLDALEDEGLEGIDLTRLSSVSLRWSGSWDWLVELHCSSVDAAGRVVCGEACVDLLGDLRLLGMRPSVAVAPNRADRSP